MVDTPSLVTLFIHLKVTLCCPSRTSTLLGDWPSTHLAAVSTWSAEMRAPLHLHNPKGIILLCTDLNCNFTKEWCQWSLELPMPLAMDTHSPQCPGLQLFCSRWVLGLASATAALLGMPQLHSPTCPPLPFLFFASICAVKETNKTINVQTSWPYFGVKLSCVCLKFA